MVPKFSRRIFLWMKLEVIEVTHYTDKLFRIKLERPRSYRFTAGEFTMIGFPDEKIKRAYSFTICYFALFFGWVLLVFKLVIY